MRTVSLFLLGLAFLSPARSHAADPRTDEKIAKLIQTLKDPERGVVLAAMERLGACGSAAKKAVPILGDLFRHGVRDVRDRAARTLGQIGPASLPELVRALKDPAPKPGLYGRALSALKQLGPDAWPAVGPVSELLTNKDAKVRALAAEVLSEVGPRAWRSAWAAQALHDIGPENVRYLLTALKDEDPAVRVNAVQGLAVFAESRDAAGGLAEAVRDADVRVRAAAAEILFHLGTKARFALPGLLKNLEKTGDPPIQALTAILAIGSMDDVALLDALATLNEQGHWKQAQARSKHAVKSLLKHTENGRALLRLGAVLALGQMGPEAKLALTHLSKLLEDGDPRMAAASVLAVAAIDPGRKTRIAKAAEIINQNLAELKSFPQLDAREVVQLYILVSTIPHLALQDERLRGTVAAARRWLAQAVIDLPEKADGIDAVVEGVNVTAQLGLGFTEPYARLCLKVQALIDKSRDPAFLVKTFNSLGKNVPATSPHVTVIQRLQFQILKNQPFMEGMVSKQQQRLQMMVSGNVLGLMTPLALEDQKMLAILGNSALIWLPLPES